MPSLRITTPGFYPNMSAADYHADPCPSPALSQSCVKTILDRSPWHAWTNHPRLNPKFERDEDKKFDVGNVAHKLVLGRGKDFMVLEYENWTTKAAKEARAAAIAAGKVGILRHQYERAVAMVDSCDEQLDRRSDLGPMFGDEGAGDGNAELVMCWSEGSTWFKQMLDWRSSDGHVIADYKTTDLSIADHNLGRMMQNAGWHIQAAFADRGLGVLAPETNGRRKFRYVVQEAYEPFALQVVAITPEALTTGRKLVDMAVDIWQRCMAGNNWPGYSLDIARPQLPGWAEQQILDREIAAEGKKRVRGDFADDFMMGG